MLQLSLSVLFSVKLSCSSGKKAFADATTELDGKEDGLYFYRKIVEQSKDYLNPGGSLMFEIGYDQGKDVSEMMEEAGFLDVCVKKDLAGHDRVVTGML